MSGGHAFQLHLPLCGLPVPAELQQDPFRPGLPRDLHGNADGLPLPDRAEGGLAPLVPGVVVYGVSHEHSPFLPKSLFLLYTEFPGKYIPFSYDFRQQNAQKIPCGFYVKSGIFT